MIAQSGRLEYHVVWLHYDRSTWEVIWKNILYLWISHFTLTETHRCENYFLSLHFNKKDSQCGQCWHIYLNRNRLKNSWIAVERSEMTCIPIHIIANQNSCHDDKSAQLCLTRVFCPQLIGNVWTRRRIDYYRPPSKFRHTPIHRREMSLKTWNQDLDMCRYKYIDITLSIIDMDFAISIDNTEIM